MTKSFCVIKNFKYSDNIDRIIQKTIKKIKHKLYIRKYQYNIQKTKYNFAIKGTIDIVSNTAYNKFIEELEKIGY